MEATKPDQPEFIWPEGEDVCGIFEPRNDTVEPPSQDYIDYVVETCRNSGIISSWKFFLKVRNAENYPLNRCRCGTCKLCAPVLNTQFFLTTSLLGKEYKDFYNKYTAIPTDDGFEFVWRGDSLPEAYIEILSKYPNGLEMVWND